MRKTGTVKFFNGIWGFIIPDEGGPDIHVHHNAIQHNGWRMLAAGERVEFDIRKSDKGPMAANVVKI